MAFTYYKYGPQSITLPEYLLLFAVIDLTREVRNVAVMLKSVNDRRKEDEYKQ